MLQFPELEEVVLDVEVALNNRTKSRNHWKLGIVANLIKGRDGVVRGAKVRTSKGSLERPIQQLYPLELRSVTRPNYVLNPEAPKFTARPKRNAALAAPARIQEIVERSEHCMP